MNTITTEQVQQVKSVVYIAKPQSTEAQLARQQAQSGDDDSHSNSEEATNPGKIKTAREKFKL